MTLADLKNKKIAILGLGVNNRHLAEYFLSQKINFEVLDGWQSPVDLVGRLDHYDIIFRTPGLPYLSKPIQQAKQKGVEIFSQTKLFFELCPCPIIGVTGTKGKGTTATLIAKILEAEALRPPQADSGRKVYLSGNIGQDPFKFLDEMRPEDFVVLELSSFQLQDLKKSPQIAVVLKITPDHLDYHKNFEEYLKAKKPILVHQTTRDWAVLNYDNETTRNFANFTPATKLWNSIMQKVDLGCFVENDKIVLNFPSLDERGNIEEEGGRAEIMKVSEIQLLGRFNLENVTAAIAAAAAGGVSDPGLMRNVVQEFNGLPHRLELAGESKGVKFYNDSCSTTPETAMAAISAFDSPIILIVGGSEKNADYTDLAQTIAKGKIKALMPMGTTGPKIAALARKHGYEGRIIEKELKDMDAILKEAHDLAAPHDIVLLSPASASFDRFHDYKHRGELFKKFVRKL